MNRFSTSLLFLTTVLMASVSCKREEVQVYQAPKDVPQSAPSAAAESAPPAPSGAGAKEPERKESPPWAIQEGWVEKPRSGMRAANYDIRSPDGREAEVTVVALNGDAGGELANVNRWRREIGLDDMEESGLSAVSSPVKIGATSAKLYDITGEKPTEGRKWVERTLASPLAADAITVFFKLRGEKELVAANRDKFIAFLNSVKVGQPSPNSPGATASAPASSAPSSAPSGSATSGGANEMPKWEVPAGWKSVAPGPMVLAAFQAPNDLAVTISALGPRAGGALANINRWRGQVGLEAVSTADLPSVTTAVTIPDGKAMFVDFTGTKTPRGESKPTRLMAIMVERADKTWFYKLVGDPEPTGKAKDAFIDFARSAKY